MRKKNQLFEPGTLVRCRSSVDNLTLWGSYRCDIEDDVDYVVPGDILVVIKNQKASSKNDDAINDEWRMGAYQVLTPRGVTGWVGAGWIEKLPPDS